MTMPSAGDVVRHVIDNGGLFNTIANLIIRPDRSNYTVEDLGPSVFRLGDRNTQRFERVDMELRNMQDMAMSCSWFRPVKMTGPLPCVVYCHANCGSRYDSLEALYLLQHGFTLFSFDFCGSGMSDGQYISLGFYERQDLAEVVSYLQLQRELVDGVALWGRSMGAVTAVMYAARDPSVRAIVCDSAFASLRRLIDDLVKQHGRYLPNIVVRVVVDKIQKRILERALFDINDLDTVKYASMCTVPALLFHGRDDDFVSYSHGETIRSAYHGECVFECVAGGHNDERSEKLRDFIAAYLKVYTVEKPQAARQQHQEGQAEQRALEKEMRDTALEALREAEPLCAHEGQSTRASTAAGDRDRPSTAQALPISFTKPRLTAAYTDPTRAPEAWNE